MKRNILIIIVGLLTTGQCFGQYYTSSLKKDLAPMTIGVGLTGLSYYLTTNAASISIAEINMLDPANLNFLDRGVINNYSSFAKGSSDFLLLSTISFPFISFLSNNSNEDRFTISLMALEAGLVNYGLTYTIKTVTNRYRPLSYNPDVPSDVKLAKSTRRSFISGHVSQTATFSFLAARIISDLNPEMKHKYLVWASAATLPAVMGFLRVKAGKHFPTDVIGGYAVGALVGYIIPSLHISKDTNLNVNAIGISRMEISFNF